LFIVYLVQVGPTQNMLYC